MPTQNKFWAGTAESFNAAVEGMAKAQAYLAERGGREASDLPTIWNREDSVAVINVSGSLINGSAGYYGQFFGVLGYDDIRRAAVEAASDPEVKTILMHVTSGGGAVAGVDDLADFLSKINKLKPVAVYTDSMMASAAYWLASGASTIMASSTAIVGSLGVLSVHVERSAQLKADGVVATVVRAGKYKALANSIEPLSELALAEVQGQVDSLYDIFMSRVASGRNVSTAVADKQMGQGREFLGKAAATAGLIDKVATYDQAFAAAKKLDNSSVVANNPQKPKGTTVSTKANLNPAQLAALAAGASLEAVAAAATANVEATDTAQAALEAAAAAATEAAAAEAAATEATAAAEAAAAEAAAGNTAAFAEPSAVTLLQGQLATANASLLAVSVEAAGYKSQLAASSATHEGLLAIARAAVGKMAVALGGSAEASATLDAASVIAQYTQTEATFNSKFKVGGVTAPAQADKKVEAVMSPLELAMIQAAQGK